MRWLGRMAALVMLAVLGWLGADIYWTVNAPESVVPSAQMETELQKVQQALTARHLFGVYVVASATASAPSDIRLNGVIAAEKAGQRAYALLSLEGKPAQLVKEGEQVAPGITLQRVLPRQVELLRGGQPLTLTLPETSKTPAEAAKAAAPGAPAPSGSPAQSSAPPATLTTLPAPPTPPAPPARRKTRRIATDDDT